jgi:hypothetical protein
LPYHENSSKNKAYHAMKTAKKTKHNIPREQLQIQNIPYHENTCSHGMVCLVFGAVLMVWYVLFFELFSWYGMIYFWSCSHGMV